MKVVLLDDVDNLGEAGDVVDVKGGHARNWLIPQKLADFARPELLNRIEQIKKTGEERRLARLKEEKQIIESIAGKIITIYAKSGQENRLFGAITSQVISDSIMELFGTRLSRKFIRLASPIKHLGEFPVELRASSEIKGEISVIVKNEDDREKDLAAISEAATNAETEVKSEEGTGPEAGNEEKTTAEAPEDKPSSSDNASEG
ncbi:50S ribosomal protein L9 [bacterium]|nr:50S ribosomal protein L9 [bacterium]